VELVLPAAPQLSAASTRALQEGARGATGLTKRLPHGDRSGGFWSAAHTLRQLRTQPYFTPTESQPATNDDAGLPAVLAALEAAGERGEAALAALGGCANLARITQFAQGPNRVRVTVPQVRVS
jgi:hypothetical protein